VNYFALLLFGSFRLHRLSFLSADIVSHPATLDMQIRIE